jgi:nucleotide-binding universal stress UspA family protein
MRVLIGYDGSDHANTAIDDLKWAGLAEDTEAIVLSSIEWPAVQAVQSWGMVETDFSPEWMERINAARTLAENGAVRVRERFPGWKVGIEPSAGNPADALLEKASTWPADLIVIGTHGRSAVGRALLGSVSLQLIREAPCSVRVARATKHEGAPRILIGIDGSPEAEATIDQICRRSWPLGTKATVLTVHELLAPINSERLAFGATLYDQVNQDEHLRLKYVAREAAQKMHLAGLMASPMLQEGNPREVLVHFAKEWNANTIFVGARGLGRVEGLLLGSVSSAAVAHAPCTVEVVRQQAL